MDKNLNDCKKFLLFYSLKKSNIFHRKEKTFSFALLFKENLGI